MSVNLKPYPEYKNSGLPWLSDIPAHWQVLLGRASFREKQTTNTNLAETTVLSLSYGAIVVKPIESQHGLVPSSYETYQIIEPGDIVIRPTDLQNDKTSLRVGLSRNRGIITSAYICLAPRNSTIPEYLYRLLYAFDIMKVFYGMGSGLRQNLNGADLARMLVVSPPPAEQAAIVAFLDVMDRRINRLIRAKRRLIALLNEEKQAIIQQAVTRGLDPQAPLKQSGVDWLGDVPAHWSIVRLKFLASNIVDCLHATPVYDSAGEYPAIRTADIEPGRVLLDRARRIDREQYERWTSRLVPHAGDILYSREGERYGIAATVPGDVSLCVSQRMMIIRISSGHCSTYMMWQMNCPHIYAQASEDIVGATAPHVNVERIQNYYMGVPPLSEQLAITDAIEDQTREVEQARQRTLTEIGLLHEYRARLIADVVTGKLDVRGVELPALDEDDLAEHIDIDEDETIEEAIDGEESGDADD